MKIKCPLCGFENEEGSKFCKNCNEPLFKQGYSEDNPYIKKRRNKDHPFKLISDEEAKTKNRIEKESEAVCPYCKKVLEQKPQRKKKCPFCKNFIYVRTLPSTRSKILVTEDEAKKIDLEWEKVNFRNKWLSNLKQYRITEKDFGIHKDKLSKKFGQEASDRDVIWSIFNELLTKIRDLHSLKMIYYEMALFLNEEGKDCFTVLQQSAKMELMKFKQEGFIKKVRILIGGEDSCEACQRLKNKVFTLEEALENMPIPCKECTHKLYDEKRGFCRCCYVAEID